MGIEQLIGRPRRTRHNIMLFFISILAAVTLYNHALLANGITPRYPWSAFLYLTSVFTVGPLTFAYYHLLLYPGRKIKTRHIRHLIPAMIVLLIEIYLQTQPHALKQQALETTLNTNSINFLIVLLLIGGAVYIRYHIILLAEAIPLWNDRTIKKGVRLICLIGIANILIPVPVILWMIFRNGALFLAAGIMTTAVMVTVFLTNNRFPVIFNLMKKELERRKYARSFLKGLDTAGIRARLSALMENEKVYRDSELSLQTLSGQISLTPHQLSQFLNEQLNTSFNTFVNRYRVEEAKILLNRNKDSNVLSICFFVGFNSKSSFNTIFKSLTGYTPTAFRSHGNNN